MENVLFFSVSEQSVSVTTGSFLLQACGDETMCPVIYWKVLSLNNILFLSNIYTQHNQIEKRIE
jgi:hypothetical protein